MSEVTALLRISVKEEVSTQMAKAKKEIEGFKQQAGSAAGAVKDLFRELAGPAAGLGAAAGLALLAKESIYAASSLQALHNRAEVVFGNDFRAMQDAANSLGQQLNRSGSDILGFTTDFTSLMTGMRIGQKDAQDMAVELTKLSVAFGKAFHMADADAFQMLQAAMRGNTKALGQLGIIMDDTTVKQHALSRGWITNTKDLNEAQMMVLRYNTLQEKTANVQKIAAKETGGFNDQVQALKGSWNDLMEEIGNSGALNLATAALNATSAAVRNLGDTVADVRRGFTGGSDPKIQAMLLANGLHGKTSNTVPFGPAQKFGPFQKDIEGVGKASAETDKKVKELVESLKGPGSGGGESEFKKIKEAMEDLADEYDDAGDKIRESLADLETQHAGTMESLKDQLDGVTDSLAKMEAQYKRTTNSLANDEIDSVARQIEKVNNLKKEVDDMSFFSGRTGEDGMSMLMGLRQGKDLGDITKTEQHGFGWSDDTVKQINAFMELQKQQASLDSVLGTRSDKNDLLMEAGVLNNLTDFEKDFGKIQERKQLEKQQYEEEKKDKLEEIARIKEKTAVEQESYTLQKQRIDENIAAMQIWHDDYTTKLQNMTKVTENEVKAMTKNLQELQQVLSASQSLTQAKFNVQSGVDDRRDERAASGPGVTVVIQTMNVEKTADADEVIRRITRDIEKQYSQAP